MKEVNWQMKESFAFPNEIGQPESAENIKITPRFTVEEFEGRPKLTGIYHIAVNVNLTESSKEMPPVDDAILIDDLDINEGSGYFEYALPFNIDFPPEAETPVELKVENPAYEVESGQLAMIWDVKCAYTEAGIGQSKEQPTIEKETASADEKVEPSTKTVEKPKVESSPELHSEQKVEVASKPNRESVSETAKAPVETTVFTDSDDEVLDFIAQLEDDVSTTSFRLNDVFV